MQSLRQEHAIQSHMVLSYSHTWTANCGMSKCTNPWDGPRDFPT